MRCVLTARQKRLVPRQARGTVSIVHLGALLTTPTARVINAGWADTRLRRIHGSVPRALQESFKIKRSSRFANRALLGRTMLRTMLWYVTVVQLASTAHCHLKHVLHVSRANFRV